MGKEVAFLLLLPLGEFPSLFSSFSSPSPSSSSNSCFLACAKSVILSRMTSSLIRDFSFLMVKVGEAERDRITGGGRPPLELKSADKSSSSSARRKGIAGVIELSNYSPRKSAKKFQKKEPRYSEINSKYKTKNILSIHLIRLNIEIQPQCHKIAVILSKHQLPNLKKPERNHKEVRNIAVSTTLISKPLCLFRQTCG